MPWCNKPVWASVEFPKGVNEFVKAGFTPLASERIRPFRVAESPVQFECKVVEVKPMGMEGGAANLIICEILLMHINENVLDEQQRIDQHKIDLVARLGADWYVRASGGALFEVPKPNLKPAIGIDQLPDHIRNSRVLTGNELGMLGNTEHFPTREELAAADISQDLEDLKERFSNDAESLEYHKHLLAKELLEAHQLMKAGKCCSADGTERVYQF